jgi:hypothetical protein
MIHRTELIATLSAPGQAQLRTQEAMGIIETA